MQFPNLIWAIRQNGSQFKLASLLGESESWLSRRLTGRCDFSAEDRERIARTLSYPAQWLFATPNPPARDEVTQPEFAGAAA